MGIVDGVEWIGLENLSPSFLNTMLTDLKGSSNIEELDNNLVSLSKKLSSLSLFKELHFSLKEGKEKFIILCHTKELKRRLNIGTKIIGTSQPKPSLSADGTIYNFLIGWGERLSLSASMGLDEKEPYRVSLGIPFKNSLLTLQGSRNHSAYRPFSVINDSSAYKHHHHHYPYRSDLLSLDYMGFMVGLEERRGAVAVAAAGHRRDLSGRKTFIRKSFPFNGKIELGIFEELDSSLSFIPSLLRWPPPPPYIKVETRYDFKKIFLKSFEFSSSTTASFLGGHNPLKLDHFFMGGPTSLRGFHPSSIGPWRDGECLGGRIKLESGISISHPIFFSSSHTSNSQIPLKGHIFFNAGLIANPKVTTSSSCGVGFILKIDEEKKIELNLSFPAFGCRKGFPSSSSFKDHISFGFGVDFLA